MDASITILIYNACDYYLILVTTIFFYAIIISLNISNAITFIMTIRAPIQHNSDSVFQSKSKRGTPL